MKYPLLAVTLFYVSGILAAEIVSFPAVPLMIGSLLLTFAAMGVSRCRSFLLYSLLILFGLTNACLHRAILSQSDLRNIAGRKPHLVRLQGQLIETPGHRVTVRNQEPLWRTLSTLRVSAVRLEKTDWRPAVGCVAVTTRGTITNFVAGQRVVLTGVLAPPKSAIAEGCFDYRGYLRNQGIYYQLLAESQQDWEALGAAPPLPLSDRFSAWARRALARGMPIEDESLRLEWALTLGWRTALTEETCEPFVRAATYHIFAVDGLRMAIIFGIFYTLLRVLNVPRQIGGLVLVPVIWFYVALTGWPASAIRACVMLTIIIMGWVLKRPSNPINSLLAAAVIILTWQPAQLFQAGFQLSFIVVLCLILIIPPLFKAAERLTAPDPWLPAQLNRRWPAWWAVPARYMADLLITSFAAWIGSLPLVAYYFNIITPVSTPANLVAVPLCVLVLISNLLSLILSAWFPAAAILFNHAGWFGMECIRISSDWFAQWPAAYWYTTAPSWFTSGVYYGLLLAVCTGWLFQPAHRLKKFAALAAVLLVWAGFCWNYCAESRLTILPASGGTMVYCDRPGSSLDVMVDVGPSNSVPFVAKPFLRAQGVNRLPSLVLTHGDVRHIGGTEPLIQLFNTPPIYTNCIRFRSPVYRRVLERLNKTGEPMRALAQGDRIHGWVVLHPAAGDRFDKADDGALVLKAKIDGTEVLLLSDLGPAGQETLLKRYPDLRSDVLVTGLPSGPGALREELLQAVRPRLIIICDSEYPISEKTPPKLRTRLRNFGVNTLFTSDVGGVTLRFRQGHWDTKVMADPKLEGADSEAALQAGEPSDD